ncbi:MAG: hypothetical protein FNP40_15985 [Dehalobacter sp. 4CP]|uniref:hemerythrin domain-containing protein n=1 Tax=Dehalobacter sp. CP TaxID=2594474 RepID=UPI0013CD443E|nr:hypothetical protein [Dehalobacter sp. 4CP]
MDKNNINKQHSEIRRAIIELQEDVYDEEEVRKNQLNISLRIGNLSGILLSHLNYEDLFIYPSLTQHHDEKIRKMAQDFQEEMGDLSSQFENYQHKYLRKPEALKSNTLEFIKDTEQILYKISKRVEKEEFELFLIID